MPDIDPVAIYGAALATFTFAWKAVDDLRSGKRRLKVSAFVGVIYVPTGVVQPNYQAAGRYVTFKARNVGRLDVKIQSCGLAKTKVGFGGRRVLARKQLTLPENFQFPQEIRAGHDIDAVAKLETFVGTSVVSEWRGFDRPYFTDALGKTHLGSNERGLLSALKDASAPD